MTCKNCYEGTVVATQVPYVTGGFGSTAYALALTVVLMFGGAVGWGLAGTGEGWDLSWALVVIPVVLIVCTPLVIFGAFRHVSEREVWRCTNCDHVFERA